MTHGAIRDGASQREVQGERQESTGALAARLSALEQVDLGALKQEWRRLYGTEPPQLSRDLILRAVAYRIQERASGGLSKTTERRLARHDIFTMLDVHQDLIAPYLFLARNR